MCRCTEAYVLLLRLAYFNSVTGSSHLRLLLFSFYSKLLLLFHSLIRKVNKSIKWPAPENVTLAYPQPALGWIGFLFEQAEFIDIKRTLNSGILIDVLRKRKSQIGSEGDIGHCQVNWGSQYQQELRRLMGWREREMKRDEKCNPLKARKTVQFL